MTDAAHGPQTIAADEGIARVVKTLPGGRLVLDVGLRDGVRVDDVFAIFEPGEEVHDPDDGALLGVVERVKAHLVAEHVQPTLTQLGPLPDEPRSTAGGQVLSAVLARTTQPPPRNSAPGRRARPAVGDRARLLVRR